MITLSTDCLALAVLPKLNRRYVLRVHLRVFRLLGLLLEPLFVSIDREANLAAIIKKLIVNAHQVDIIAIVVVFSPDQLWTAIDPVLH